MVIQGNVSLPQVILGEKHFTRKEVERNLRVVKFYYLIVFNSGCNHVCVHIFLPIVLV